MNPAISRLALEAVGGSENAFGELWQALVPHAQRIARGQFQHKRIKTDDIEDVSQELLCRVPRVIDKLREKIDSVADGNVSGWIIKAMQFHAQEIARDLRNEKLTSSELDDGKVIDWDEPGFEPLPDIECVYCGKTFAQRNPEILTCSKACNSHFRTAKNSMMRVSGECLSVLNGLRNGNLDSISVPANQVSRRIALLRCMGYEITDNRLIREPEDRKPFEHRAAVAYFAETSPVLTCAHCGAGYTFSGANHASNFCSPRCSLNNGNKRRRQSKVQVESSSCHQENAGCCGSHR